ncbi:MAG: DNA polymerase sliding clamp [Candidatus Marsarchaeota archaeon]
MAKLVLKDPREFRDIIQNASSVISEGVFRVSSKGLVMKELDPSRIAMLEFDFPPSAFEKLEVEEDEKLGVNLEELLNVLKRLRPEDTLTLESDKGKLTVSLTLNKYTRSFKIPLLDLGGQETPTINVQFTSKYNILSDALSSGVKDAATVADEVVFSSSKDGTLLISASSDKGSVEQRLTKESGMILDAEVSEEATAKYSLQYLETVTSFRGTPSVVLEFAQDKPLHLEYKMADGASFHFILAPRL